MIPRLSFLSVLFQALRLSLQAGAWPSAEPACSLRRIAGRRRITSYFLYFSAGTFLLGLATGGVPFLSGMGIAGIALFIFAFSSWERLLVWSIFHFKFSCKQQCRLITAAGCLAPFRARQPSPPSSAWRAEACWRNGSVFHLLFLSVAAC